MNPTVECFLRHFRDIEFLGSLDCGDRSLVAFWLSDPDLTQGRFSESDCVFGSHHCSTELIAYPSESTNILHHNRRADR